MNNDIAAMALMVEAYACNARVAGMQADDGAYHTGHYSQESQQLDYIASELRKLAAIIAERPIARSLDCMDSLTYRGG